MFENRNDLVTKNLLHQHKAVFLTQIVKNNDLKAPNPLCNLIFLMPFVCQSYVLVYHSYVVLHYYIIRMSLVCHAYVTRMYSYVIRMSLVYTPMSFVCHSCVLVCRWYVTRMYSYVIRMSLVYTQMSFICHSYVLVCHLYVTLYVIVCHSYVTCMYSYVIRVSLECGFIINRILVGK